MDESEPSTWNCSECGSSELESAAEGGPFKLVCTECGYVDEYRMTAETEIESTTKNESNQKYSEKGTWEYWYPCPECGSTRLKQTQVAIVLATEDGAYGGEDDPDFDETIECAECGEILLE